MDRVRRGCVKSEQGKRHTLKGLWGWAAGGHDVGLGVLAKLGEDLDGLSLQQDMSFLAFDFTF